MKVIRFLILVFISLIFNVAEAQINYAHFIQQARLDLTEGRYKESIGGLNVAIAAKPENFEGYFLRGLAKYSLEDFMGAIADFDKTLEIHPMYVRAFQYRAISNDRLGNLNEALADFQRAISLDPFDADIFFARGITYLHLNKYQEAIEDYDMVLTIDNKMSLAFVNRGIAKSHLKRFDDALADFDKAIYYDFMNPDVYFHRAMVQVERDAYDEALADFNEAIRLDAQNPLYYFNRAVTELHKNDTVSALRDYEKVNELDKRNALTYYNRGILYANQKDFNKALQMFDNVTLINPKNIYGYFNRSIVYCELKRWSEAEADLTQVLQLFPEFVGAWINRSVVRSSKGDRRGAEMDHLTAMNIIRMLNGADSNAELLYRKYADSTHYSRIIAFESDFVNGEAKESQLQYADVQILPFGNFVLTFVNPSDYKLATQNKGMYIDATISQINSMGFLPAKLVLKPESRQTFANETLVSENDIASIGDERLKILLQGIVNQEFYDFQQAENCYRKLMDTKPYSDYATLNLSSVLTAKAEMMAMVKEPPQTVTITKGKANATEEKPLDIDCSEVVNLLSFSILKESRNSYLWFNLGNALLQQKEYNKAIDAYSEAIDCQGNLAEAYYNRALTLVFIGETKLAQSDLSKAGELGLSEAYAVMKRFGK